MPSIKFQSACLTLILLISTTMPSCAAAGSAGPGNAPSATAGTPEKQEAVRPASATVGNSAPDAFSHLPEDKRAFYEKLVAAAKERTNHEVRYDGAYVSIPYPGGDVPAGTGVCTDVIIRSYRAVGVDLQKDVHEDMKRNFNLYPRTWGLSGTDTNIDHRRVPNLMAFFARKGEKLPVTDNPADYKPGDLVTQTVPPNLPHIAIVSDVKAPGKNRYYIVHNIGRGPRMEDRLFEFEITGHYRYYGNPRPQEQE